MGNILDTVVESRSSSLHTPLTSSEQHLPSFPIPLRVFPSQVSCNILSSSAFLCTEYPSCQKGKQATPQMQESVTLKILKTNGSLCCLPSLYDHCLRIKDSRQDVEMTRVTLACTPSTQGQHKAVRYAHNNFEMKLFQAHWKHLSTYGSAQDPECPGYYEPKIPSHAWYCTISCFVLFCF